VTRSKRAWPSLVLCRLFLLRVPFLLVAPSCTAPLPPPEDAPPAPPAPPAELAGGFRRVVAVGQALELLLPDASAWQRDSREAHSWVALHSGTRSRLVVRSWRADTIVTPVACEQQMRIWRPDLPLSRAEARLETRALRLPGDTDAELSSAASAAPDASGTLAGYAQLVASDGRRCSFVAYATAAEGPERARLVGARLAIMSASFERVRLLDISARVESSRERAPDGPATLGGQR
jgi:hypothetical protein